MLAGLVSSELSPLIPVRSEWLVKILLLNVSQAFGGRHVRVTISAKTTVNCQIIDVNG